MSRVGKQPIPVPEGVEINIDGKTVTVKGKNGELSWAHHANMSVSFDADTRLITVTRPDEERQNRALHGLTRSLIANMVQGVTTYYEKRLEIQGVGYNAVLDGKILQLHVGYANAIRLPIPELVICELSDQTHIVLKSADKQAVGQFAAEVRTSRPPDPYKGKGVRYLGEQIRRKAGKAFASGG